MTTVLPAAPTRADPANFAARADMWVDATTQFSADMNVFAATVQTAVDTVTNGLNAPKWINGASYTAFVSYVTSPASGLIYMRLTTGTAAAGDPSVDTTNWTLKTVPAFPLMVVSGTTQTAVKNYHYEMTNSAQSTLTLPASPSVGDTLVIGFTNSRADNVVARNGQPIVGVAEDMLVDWPYFCATFTYVNATIGWRFWA